MIEKCLHCGLTVFFSGEICPNCGKSKSEPQNSEAESNKTQSAQSQDLQPQRKGLMILLMINVIISPVALLLLLLFEPDLQQLPAYQELHPLYFRLHSLQSFIYFIYYSLLCIWFFQRKKIFPSAYKAGIVISVSVSILDNLYLGNSTPKGAISTEFQIFSVALLAGIGGLWFWYLTSSKHVREIFTR